MTIRRQLGASRQSSPRVSGPCTAHGEAIAGRISMDQTQSNGRSLAQTVHTSAYFGEEGINTGPRAGLLELPCRPLDALAIDGPVDFLKCDTEGAEVEVLRGAEQLIRRDRPWLMIEVHSLENALALGRLLAAWRYRFTIVRYPGYEICSHVWYAHCWFSCQPAERVDVNDPRLKSRG